MQIISTESKVEKSKIEEVKENKPEVPPKKEEATKEVEDEGEDISSDEEDVPDLESADGKGLHFWYWLLINLNCRKKTKQK
jgi:hypothetical protein